MVPKISLGVEIPHPPATIKLVLGTVWDRSRREERQAEVSIADIPDETLKEIGAEWTAKLVAYAIEARRNRENQKPSEDEKQPQ